MFYEYKSYLLRFNEIIVYIIISTPVISHFRIFCIAYHRCISSVTQSCPTVCDPMDCKSPGFPVHHQIRSLLKLMSTELVMPFTHLICFIPFSSYLESFTASGSFPMSQFLASVLEFQLQHESFQ